MIKEPKEDNKIEDKDVNIEIIEGIMIVVTDQETTEDSKEGEEIVLNMITEEIEEGIINKNSKSNLLFKVMQLVPLGLFLMFLWMIS